MKTASRFSRVIPIVSILAITAVPFAAFAIEANDVVSPIANNILRTVRILSTIVFVLAIVAFGWGIVMFIFAGGDPSALGKAKSFLLWGVIGMAVMASVFGLTDFLRRYFGVEGGAANIIVPNVQ